VLSLGLERRSYRIEQGVLGKYYQFLRERHRGQFILPTLVSMGVINQIKIGIEKSSYKVVQALAFQVSRA
jgi:hypothetical protein